MLANCGGCMCEGITLPVETDQIQENFQTIYGLKNHALFYSVLVLKSVLGVYGIQEACRG